MADDKEAIRLHIQSIQREIDELERIRAVMINETARNAIDLHIKNLVSEKKKWKELAK